MSQEDSSKKRKLDAANGVFVNAKEFIDLEAEESDEDDYESDDLGSLDYDDEESDEESDDDDTMIEASTAEVVTHEFAKNDVYVLEISEDCTFNELKKLINEKVPKDKFRYGLYTIKYK